jgi:hypothetical protein
MDQDQIAELIDQLTQHEGWTYVEDYINGRISDCENRLIHSCHAEEVKSIRDVREALLGVIQHVEELKHPTE